MPVPANHGCTSRSLVTAPVCLPSSPACSIVVPGETRVKIPPLVIKLSHRYYEDANPSSRFGQICKKNQETISCENREKNTSIGNISHSRLSSSRFDAPLRKRDISTSIPLPTSASSSRLGYPRYGPQPSIILPRRPPSKSPGPRSRAPQERRGPGSPAVTRKGATKAVEIGSKTSARPKSRHCITPPRHVLHPLTSLLPKSQTLGSLERGEESVSSPVLNNRLNKGDKHCHRQQIEFVISEDSAITGSESSIRLKGQTQNEQGETQMPGHPRGKDPEAKTQPAVAIRTPVHKRFEDVRMASGVVPISRSPGPKSSRILVYVLIQDARSRPPNRKNTGLVVLRPS